jgi:ABC-type Na+ efflux pump permease subunit
MSRVLSVAWRDFKHTVMTKAFLFAIVGVPILLVGIIAIAAIVMMGHKEPPLIGTVAVAAPDDAVIEAIRAEFDPERIKREQDSEAAELNATAQGVGAMAGTTDYDAAGGSLSGMPVRGEVDISIEALDRNVHEFTNGLKQRLEDGDLLAVAIIPQAAIDNWKPDDEREDEADAAREDEGDEKHTPSPTFRLLVNETMDTDHIGLIEKRLGQAVVSVRAEQEGVDLESSRALLKRPRADTDRLIKGGETKSEGEAVRALKQVIPMVLLMLLWGATFGTGNQLLMSTIEEKSNKVMEVLLSAVSPMQLMTGKIIGLGLVGLIIVAVYSSAGIAGLVVANRLDLIDTVDLIYFALYFFMAYFMVASMMAAVGSAVSDLREANTLLTPVMLLLMVPLFLWMPISQAPNGGVATAFSFIPPAIPFVMILRIGADEAVPLMHIPLTLIWGYLCTFGMMWLAAKIFRVGVLMYGKPPSPIELIKWARYS